jgi:dephospho-CoA kinase
MKRTERLELADIVIDNSGSLERLESVVEALHVQFLARAELGT